MRRACFACLVLVALLATGCQVELGAQPGAQRGTAPGEADSIDPQQVETAALFAVANHFGDSKQLSAMIAPEDAAQWADELATIPGTAIDVEQVRYEYPDYLEGEGAVGAYGDLEVLVSPVGPSRFMTSCLREGSAVHYHVITLVEGESGLVVDSIDAGDAVVALLRMSPAGLTCLQNMALLTDAAKTSRARSADYTVPASPEALIPEFIDAVPQCPSGGQYGFDDNAVAACSIHRPHGE